MSKKKHIEEMRSPQSGKAELEYVSSISKRKKAGEKKLRKTGINILGNVPWGTHFCLFYHTSQDLADILVPYFKAGLESNEFCMWITSEPLNSEDAKRLLKQAVGNLDSYIKKGQIEILNYSDWYTKTEVFETDKVLQGWVQKHDQAIERGFDGLRLTGNTFWLEKKDWGKFAGYEAVVNSVIGKYKILAVCTYSLEQCGASEILDVEQNHQFSLIKWKSDWKILESSDRNQIEARLAEQTMIAEALERSKKEWVETFNAISDWVVLVDLRGRILRTNLIGEEFIGIPLDEIIWQSCCKLVHGSEKHIPDCPLKKMLETGRRATAEFQVPGTDRWLMVTVDPVTDKEGNILAAVHITRDITERKKAKKALTESESKLNAMLLSIGDHISMVDKDLNIIWANETATKNFGNDIVGKKCYDVYHKRSKSCEPSPCITLKAFQDGNVHEHDTQAIMKAGEKRYYHCTANVALRNEDGKPTAVIVISRDITEQKKAEEALRESQELFISFMDQLPAVAFIKNERSQLQYANPYMRKVFGANKWVGLVATDHYPIEVAEKLLADDRKALVLGPLVKEDVVPNKQGIKRLFETHKFPIRRQDKPALLGGIAIDVTERKKAEEKLRESEERFKQVAESAGNWIWEVNAEGLYTYSSPIAERILGYKPEEIVGKKYFYDFFVPYEREELKKAAFDVFAKKESFKDFINSNVHKNGSIVILETTGSPITDDKGNLLGYRGADNDITKHKRAEEALQDKKEVLQTILDNIPVMIAFLDPRGKHKLVNQAWQKKLGWSLKKAQLRNVLKEFYPDPQYYQHVVDFIRKAESKWGDFKTRRRDGTVLDTTWANVPLSDGSNIGIGLDITERKQAEEKLIRLNKMLKMLTSINQDMLQIKDRLELFKKICERIIEYAYKLVWIGFCDERTKKVIPEAQAGFEEGYLNSIRITYDETKYGKGPTGTAIKTGRPNVMRFIARDDRYKPWRKEALKRGYRSSAAIPIFTGGKVIGAINVYADKEDAFSDEEIKLLGELAHNISIGLRGIDEEIRRKQAEKKLLDHQARLKSLASELTLTEERERRHIAVELHDQIAQSLVISKIKLDKLHSSASSKVFTKEINEIRNSLYQTIQDIQSLTFDLSYPILYELGFEAAVAAWLVEQIQEKYGITTEFEDDKQPKPMDKDVCVLLFRAVRELLINVVKHANASKVKVSTRKAGNQIQVCVEDDGIGFDVDKVFLSSAKNGGGFGFFSIRERLEELGGNLKIDSKHGHGTKVTLIAPLKEQNTKGEQE